MPAHMEDQLTHPRHNRHWLWSYYPATAYTSFLELGMCQFQSLICKHICLKRGKHTFLRTTQSLANTGKKKKKRKTLKRDYLPKMLWNDLCTKKKLLKNTNKSEILRLQTNLKSCGCSQNFVLVKCKHFYSISHDH